MIDPQMLDKMRRHKLCYLMTPYTKYASDSPYWTGITASHRDSAKFAAGLIKNGVHVFSPIAHSHPIALFGELDPLDYPLWATFNVTFMDLCDAGIVAQLPGWTESVGVNQEIGYFDSAKKPLYYLPGDTFK